MRGGWEVDPAFDFWQFSHEFFKDMQVELTFSQRGVDKGEGLDVPWAERQPEGDTGKAASTPYR
jgi:hypothetical protein